MSAALTDPRRLRDRIDELEEEVRQLREALAPRSDWPFAWGLTAREAEILTAIHAARGTATWSRLEHALWTDASHIVDPPAHIAVKVSGIRRKLAPHGVEIVAVWGEGYRLPPASRAILDAALREVRS